MTWTGLYPKHLTFFSTPSTSTNQIMTQISVQVCQLEKNDQKIPTLMKNLPKFVWSRKWGFWCIRIQVKVGYVSPKFHQYLIFKWRFSFLKSDQGEGEGDSDAVIEEIEKFTYVWEQLTILYNLYDMTYIPKPGIFIYCKCYSNFMRHKLYLSKIQ